MRYWIGVTRGAKIKSELKKLSSLAPAGEILVELRIWTWKTIFDIRVCRNVFLSYIQDVIFGNF
jgi:hypothetical protein